jgi:Flp pilus assembly protein TadB
MEARRDRAYESGAAQRHRQRGDSVSNSESENKQRDRKIAHNEAKREAVSSVRVSSWAIGLAVIAGVIAFGIVWAWLHR